MAEFDCSNCKKTMVWNGVYPARVRCPYCKVVVNTPEIPMASCLQHVWRRTSESHITKGRYATEYCIATEKCSDCGKERELQQQHESGWSTDDNDNWREASCLFD